MANQAFVTLPIGFQRINAEPFNNDQVFDSLEAAEAYAKGISSLGPIAYPGQSVTVKVNDKRLVYVIQDDHTLSPAVQEQKEFTWDTWE